MIASYYGFHSYAFEIFNSLVEDSDLLTTLEKKDLQDSLTQYLSVLENNSVEDWMRFLDNSVFRKILRWWWSVLARLYEAYQFDASRQNYSWKD